jgi:hypothetical protein
MNCPGCGKKLYVADTVSTEDPPGLIERIRYLECRECDYTRKNGMIKDVWYLSKVKAWLCEWN